MTERARILIAWWGALEGGGATAGDAMAVRSVVEYLQSAKATLDLASLYPLPGLSVAYVDWREVDPSLYSELLFVCGPIIGGSQAFQDLLQRFSKCRTIAVGTTILPSYSSDHWNPFDVVLARDGGHSVYFDVALACRFSSEAKPSLIVPSERPLIGVSLRGKQREYGLGACLHEEAEHLVRTVIDALGGSSVELEVRLERSSMDDRIIDANFALPDLVVTTRLHGALLALRHGVPALAVDQIIRDGKVTCILDWLGWKDTYHVDRVSQLELINAARRLLTKEGATQVLLSRERAERAARKTLRALGTLLLKDPAYSPTHS